MSAPARRAAQPDGAMQAAGERVRRELRARLDAAHAEGMASVELRGQLSRPLLAYAVASAGGGQPTDGFWHAVLAVQLAHEASLLHDDVLDAAATRRGRPTVAAEQGTGAALVLGDHLLTTAYRMAARTGSLAFVERFARAVERTVAGEIAQGRALGRPQRWEEYQATAVAKAGELLGCALAAGPLVEGARRAGEVEALGRRIGLFYQMLDDLLDYCPGARTGKPALGDFRQGRWTWPLLELPGVAPGTDDAEAVLRLLHAAGPGGSPLQRCLARLEADAASLSTAAEQLLGPSTLLDEVLTGWLDRAGEALPRAEAAAATVAAPVTATATVARPSALLRARVPAADGLIGYLAQHSRSFRFAVRFFPAGEADRVARVYAYCRVTDDLVDREDGLDAGAREALLDEWMSLSRRAYEGRPSGIDFLDRAMREMASAGVPFRYAAELGEGMRMDLRGVRYATLGELRVYTHRVASVVGLWITELFGVHALPVLERAAALGHAMQMTNILRDVGEDWRAGRLYLPAQTMAAHGHDEATLAALVRGERAPDAAYRAMVEVLMAAAEADYRAAFAAVPCLPAFARRPVAVAAHVYRGIHAEIRRRDYDNLRQRAYTSGPAKLRLATRALWDLWCLGARPLAPDDHSAASYGARSVLKPAALAEPAPRPYA